MLLWIDENEWDTRRVKARKIGLCLVYVWFTGVFIAFTQTQGLGVWW